MPERVKGFIITLKQPMREDEVENVRRAIELLAPVAYATTTTVLDNFDDAINRSMIRRELELKLFEALRS